MNISKCIIALLFTITAITRAQSSSDIATVNVDSGSIVNSPMKDDVRNWRLSYKAQELSLVSVKNPTTAPLHVVFVLDVSKHQQKLLPLTLDYLEQLAGLINNSQHGFTVVPATQNADFLVQAHTADELRTSLTTMDSSTLGSLASNPSLPSGILEGLKVLGAQSGSRVIVPFADDNDEIDSASQKILKLALAAAHVRCFTILIATHEFSEPRLGPLHQIGLSRWPVSREGRDTQPIGKVEIQTSFNFKKQHCASLKKLFLLSSFRKSLV